MWGPVRAGRWAGFYGVSGAGSRVRSPIFQIPRAVPGSRLPLMGHRFRVPDGGPTMARGICGAISSFHANRIGKVFLLAGGTGHWAIILWGLDTFLIFPNFLRSLS